jgi:hypothetical protein
MVKFYVNVVRNDFDKISKEMILTKKIKVHIHIWMLIKVLLTL